MNELLLFQSLFGQNPSSGQTTSPLAWLVSFFRTFYDKIAETLETVYYAIQEFIATLTGLVYQVVLSGIEEAIPNYTQYFLAVQPHVNLINYWLPLDVALGLALAYIALLVGVLPVKLVFRALT
jgi:hypothetical protein